MTHRHHLLRALAPCLLALAGCDGWIVGNGVFEEQTRDVPAFVGVSVQDGISVEVTAGAGARSVKVSGDENVLEHVITEVVNEAGLGATLVVRSDVEHIESTHPLRVSVAVPTLRHVRAVEESTVEVKAAAAPSFDVHAGDGAEVTLSGAGGVAMNVVLWGGSKGGAVLSARSYVVNDATVDVSGGALAEVHVDDRITGTVADGSTLTNFGEGACDEVAAGAGATVSCHD